MGANVTTWLESYFARVGYRGPRTPTLAALRELHARHVEAIPFENLSAFMGETVRLDFQSLLAKMLQPGRGGWCFEHNLLFAGVLESMGYEVRRLAARVRWNVPPNVTTARSHMLMRVRAEGREYIVDAGFGGLTLTAPLRLEPHAEQATLHEAHRLLPQGEGFALQARVDGEWSTMYVFDLQEHQLADYEVSNWYLSTHPQSQFVKGIIAARAAPDCRHALRNTRYSASYADGRTQRTFLESPAAFRATLRDAFHIEAPQSQRFDDKVAQLIAAAV